MKGLAIPVIMVAVVTVLFTQLSKIRTGNEGRVRLIQKGANFKPIAGGASGIVRYNKRGPTLSIRLRATGLAPTKRYLFEIQADDAIYVVTSLAANAVGTLSLDTTLVHFAEGACVGPNYDPPRPLVGRHRLKFWLKRDGNQPSGTAATHSPDLSAGRDLPCSGNGDGDYSYVLLEEDEAEFEGTGDR